MVLSLHICLLVLSVLICLCLIFCKTNLFLGYNQQMAPPAMYGNKMHQNMMGGSGSHMPPYSSQSTGHYPQSKSKSIVFFIDVDS